MWIQRTQSTRSRAQRDPVTSTAAVEFASSSIIHRNGHPNTGNPLGRSNAIGRMLGGHRPVGEAVEWYQHPTSCGWAQTIPSPLLLYLYIFDHTHFNYARTHIHTTHCLTVKNKHKNKHPSPLIIINIIMIIIFSIFNNSIQISKMWESCLTGNK